MQPPIFSSHDVLNYTSEGINPLEPKHSFVMNPFLQGSCCASCLHFKEVWVIDRRAATLIETCAIINWDALRKKKKDTYLSNREKKTKPMYLALFGLYPMEGEGLIYRMGLILQSVF